MDPATTAYLYLVSIAPTLEGRYAVVIALTLGVPSPYALAIAVAGVFTTSLLLPSLLPYIDTIAAKLSGSRINTVSRLARAYLSYAQRARRRAHPYIEKYGVPGLIVFVAIPLPATGIWTGSLAAYLLGMNPHKTRIALVTGGLLSIAITYTLTSTAGGIISRI